MGNNPKQDTERKQLMLGATVSQRLQKIQNGDYRSLVQD